MKLINELILFAGFCLSLVVISSCSKDDDEHPDTKFDLITRHSWKYNKLEIENSGTYTVIPIEDCVKDNFLTFRKDGTLIFNEGGSKCDPTDPDVENYKWSFSADTTMLSVDQSGLIIDYEIITLNSSKIVMTTDFIFNQRITLVPK